MEIRSLYEQRVEPTLQHTHLQQKMPFGRGTVKQTAVLNRLSQPVNHNGQLMDRGNTAIARAVHGDFYLLQGGAVGDIQQRTEGKAFRCRANAPPVETLRSPLKGPRKVEKDNALFNKPLVDTPRADAKHKHRHHRRYHHEEGCPHNCNSPTTNVRPASAQPQRIPVKHPPRAQSAGAKRDAAYDVALQSVKRHNPGEAAMLSGEELHRIRALTVHNPEDRVVEKRTKRRKDVEQLLF